MPTLKYTQDGVLWKPLLAGPKGDTGPAGPQGPQGVPGGVGRNRLINGDFSVTQRGVTTVFPPRGEFVFDRWPVYFSPGISGSTGLSPIMPGSIPDNAKSDLMINLGASGATAADYASAYQRIEGVRTLAGKTVTLSFWANAVGGAVSKLAVEFCQNFGSGGSPSAMVYLTAGVVTGMADPWTRHSLTFTVPSIGGKVLGTNGDDHGLLNLWFSSGSTYDTRSGGIGHQSGTLHLWGFQLEEGSVATAFEHRAYHETLAACRRYYQKLEVVNGWTDKAVPGLWHAHPDSLYSMFTTGAAGWGATGTCEYVRQVGTGTVIMNNPPLTIQPPRGTIYYRHTDNAGQTGGEWLEFTNVTLSSALAL